MRVLGMGAVVAVLAFAAVGCGGSSSSSVAAGDTTTTEVTVSTDTSASTDASTTGGDTTPSGSVAGLSGKCKDLVEAGQAFSAAIASAGGDQSLDATAKAYQEFAAKAPDELKADFKVLAKVVAKYASELKDLDLKPGATPSADQIAKLSKLGQSFQGTDVQKASADVSAWAAKNCATP